MSRLIRKYEARTVPIRACTLKSFPRGYTPDRWQQAPPRALCAHKTCTIMGIRGRYADRARCEGDISTLLKGDISTLLPHSRMICHPWSGLRTRAMPRTLIMAAKSRKLSLKLRSQRTHRTTISQSNLPTVEEFLDR